MGKTTNLDLAKNISARISEVLNATSLKLEGLAVLCSIGKSAIRSYHSKTIPISLENIAKICAPFSLEIHEFLNFNKPLPAELTKQPEFKKFYNTYIKSNPEYFVIPPDPNEINTYQRDPKDNLRHIVHDTPYFFSGRLTTEMVVDFKQKYNITYEPGRLSQMLQSHLDVLDKIPAVKYKKDGTESKKQVFKYVRKKK